MGRKKKLTHEQKVAALEPPLCGFLKDRPYLRLKDKSLFLRELEAKQRSALETELPFVVNVTRMRR